MAAKKKSQPTHIATHQTLKILVCVDEKQHSKMALDYACKMAVKRGLPIKLLHVISPADYNTFSMVAEAIKQERLTAAEALLSTLKKHAKQHYDLPVETTVMEGEIGETILQCTEQDPDITLMIIGAAIDGSSTKTGIYQAIVSELGDRLQIPLLIVPGTLTDYQMQMLT